VKKLNENIKRIKSLMMIKESEEVDSMNVNKGEDNQEPVQVSGPDGMDDDSDKNLEEISEQGEGETTSTETETTTSGTETSTKTSDYPSLNVWSSNVGRGPGNPIDDKVVWSSKATVSPNRNTKWKSGRKFGPTGNNYKE